MNITSYVNQLYQKLSVNMIGCCRQLRVKEAVGAIVWTHNPFKIHFSKRKLYIFMIDSCMKQSAFNMSQRRYVLQLSRFFMSFDSISNTFLNKQEAMQECVMWVYVSVCVRESMLLLGEHEGMVVYSSEWAHRAHWCVLVLSNMLFQRHSLVFFGYWDKLQSSTNSILWIQLKSFYF